MHELRLVAVSEDGTYLVLASAGRGTRFMLPVDDRLRAAVRGQFSRLGQYEIEVENPLRPKEIQARIRSGETAEAISEISGIPLERVRWFEGPVLQEREYMAQRAQKAGVRAQGDTAPGLPLGELVAQRIGAHQLETGDAVWDSWKREDRTWQIKLVFLHGGEERVAHWVYEPRHNSVVPADEEAALFSVESAPEQPVAPVAPPAVANVTPFAPRRPEPAAPARDDRRQKAFEEARREPFDHHPAAPRHHEERRAPGQEGHRGRGEERAPAQGAGPRRESESVPFSPSVRTEPEVRRPAPTRSDAGPARPAEQMPHAAEPPSAPPAAPRRRRSIDLGDTGTPRRAADPQPAPAAPAAPIPAAAAGDRPAPKRKVRGRRASVPSWDEIMFGAKKDE
ncbi:septation protein SepH [Nocardiopsis algeriensis]|uniref:DUF3071 domain-containing protein n=1 Tax=Nocardiopsis algeriensis TaxID=1478215 RepID=A0A841INK8_9ACTN|nr:septation protein SepH [Nocardiopsis algeriensis]MBB6119674.1 hypothetical protein [Nocardiopsis algeriensis]